MEPLNELPERDLEGARIEVYMKDRDATYQDKQGCLH